jgi:hypothetical protein
MDGGKVQRVKWAKIKSTKRAVEKLYRCYSGDVARLVDCCRLCAGHVHPRQRESSPCGRACGLACTCGSMLGVQHCIDLP